MTRQFCYANARSGAKITKSKPLVGITRRPAVLTFAAATLLLLTSKALAVTDPSLDVSLTVTNQSAVLSWNTFAGVSYQVEAGSALGVWNSISPALTGT